MANIVSQQYQQQPSINGTNSGYYGTTQSIYQQQHGGDNYNNYGASSSSQHSTYWNGQSGGYTNNQHENHFSGRTSQQVSSTAAYPRSHWYNKSQQHEQNFYVQNPPSVAIGNNSTMKRTYSTDTALHDITNGTNAPKRRRINTTHTAHVLPKAGTRNTTIPSIPPASSIDQTTSKVRIESIFRHVELLAQSYWQTGKCPRASALKPTTVDALEGGPMPTLR